MPHTLFVFIGVFWCHCLVSRGARCPEIGDGTVGISGLSRDSPDNQPFVKGKRKAQSGPWDGNSLAGQMLPDLHVLSKCQPSGEKREAGRLRARSCPTTATASSLGDSHLQLALWGGHRRPAPRPQPGTWKAIELMRPGGSQVPRAHGLMPDSSDEIWGPTVSSPSENLLEFRLSGPNPRPMEPDFAF